MRTLLFPLVCLGVFSACSSNDPAPAGTDAGKDTSPPKDSGAAVINGCADTDYKAVKTITWGFGLTPACVTVKVGDTVTWNGDFTAHPLDAFSGDTPNPIAGANATAAGGVVAVKFTSAGTFGYHCTIHASLLGAVRVTP